VISRGGIGTTTFEVTLHSPRPHQIWIHLASIGHPLVGDPLNGLTGQPLENLPGLPGDGGYLLHAQYLNFHHPITGEQIRLEAALPSGFSSLGSRRAVGILAMGAFFTPESRLAFCTLT
jgi:23S rRNA pseudouridine1911/1915/1917 synthase